MPQIGVVHRLLGVEHASVDRALVEVADLGDVGQQLCGGGCAGRDGLLLGDGDRLRSRRGDSAQQGSGDDDGVCVGLWRGIFLSKCARRQQRNGRSTCCKHGNRQLVRHSHNPHPLHSDRGRADGPVTNMRSAIRSKIQIGLPSCRQSSTSRRPCRRSPRWFWHTQPTKPSQLEFTRAAKAVQKRLCWSSPRQNEQDPLFDSRPLEPLPHTFPSSRRGREPAGQPARQSLRRQRR